MNKKPKINKDDPTLFEMLLKQEEELKKKPTFYVHYDPSSRKILNFRNYLDRTDPYPFLQLNEEEFSVPLNSFDISRFEVVKADQGFKLEKIVENILTVSKIDDFIYEIPRITSQKRITAEDRNFDILIEQNNPLKEFRIKLSRALREQYSSLNKGSQTMYIYVTAVSDPNILYKTLKFTFDNVISNEYYTIKFDDFDGNEANVYALKYFQDYLHVDIR